MIRKNLWKPATILALFIALLTGVTAYAQSEEIKARMKARLPVIDELKEQGLVGETFSGYLAFVGTSTSRAEVVEAENQDRRKVYEAIARQQGTSPEVVGRIRAQQIAERAVPGTFIQDAGGNWQKK